MSDSLSRAATVGFAAISSLLLSAVSASSSECLATNEVLRTSRVAIQVWRGSSPVDGALVSFLWEHGQAPAATGETDSQGALQIDGVPPGLYSLRVTLTGRSSVLISGKTEVSYGVRVRVVPSTESPATLIAIGLAGGLSCSTSCTVNGTLGPLVRAPKCLAQGSRN